MPRTSKGRQSQGPESDTLIELKYGRSLTGVACLMSDSLRSLLTRLPPEALHFLDYDGTIVISRRDGLTCVTLRYPPRTKAAP
jgi:hypothetical protein